MALVTIPDPDEIINILTDTNVPVKMLIQKMIDFLNHNLEDIDKIDDLSTQLVYIDMIEKVAKGLDQNAIKDEELHIRSFSKEYFRTNYPEYAKLSTLIQK